MQLYYDDAQDKLVIKCTGLYESDQLADMLSVEGLEVRDRMTLIIKEFRASGQNSFGAVKEPDSNEITPYVIVSGMSGSGRFNPGRDLIFERLGGEFLDYYMQKYSILCNRALLKTIQSNNIDELRENYRDMARFLSMDLVRIFDELTWPRTGRVCIDVHLPVLLRDLRYQQGSRIAYLFRDPRDWIVSTYHFFRNVYLKNRDNPSAPQCLDLYSESGDDKARVFKALIDGEFPHVSDRLCYVYPSVRELLEDKIKYRAKEDVFFVDYERTRLEPVEFFADFAKWIAGTPDLPPEVSQADLEKAAEMGTFSYQTKGKIQEGCSDDWVKDDGGWFRKGIVGDWQNHFTKEMKDYFKDQTGDLLIEAGYATDMDW